LKGHMSKQPTQTLRDDPLGPDLGNFLADTLEGFRINRATLEDDAVDQMTKCKGAATEYVKSLEALKQADMARDILFGTLAEGERGTGEKLTETAIKQRIMRDSRMMQLENAYIQAEIRHESAKIAMKLFWERGEIIRALLFSHNTEMRAMGAPASYETAAPGEATKAIRAKYKK